VLILLRLDPFRLTASRRRRRNRRRRLQLAGSRPNQQSVSTSLAQEINTPRANGDCNINAVACGLPLNELHGLVVGKLTRRSPVKFVSVGFAQFILVLAMILVFSTANSGMAFDESKPAEATEQPLTVKLWPPDKAPNGDGTFSPSDAKITVHLAKEPNGAAVVICPGGGYGGLVTGAEGHGIAKWLNSHGITGVVLEYRLPAGRSFVPLLDAQRPFRLFEPTRKNGRLKPTGSASWDSRLADIWHRPQQLISRRRRNRRGSAGTVELSSGFRSARLSRRHDGRENSWWLTNQSARAQSNAGNDRTVFQ
jgi:hypothetical protein